MIVLDASVILKWFLTEEDSPAAESYLEAHSSGRETVAAPSLLFLEVANALAGNRKIPEHEAREALKYLEDLRLTVCEFGREELQRSVELAKRHRITVYDACYVVTAERLGCDLVTADLALIRRIPHLTFVRPLPPLSSSGGKNLHKSVD